MKKLLLAAIVSFFSIAAFAQINAMEGKIEYQKGDKAVAIIELPYHPDVVEDALKDYMAKKGLKNDKSKGFYTYKSTKLTNADAENNDLYFKVERKSRRDKDVAIVYLLVGRPGENVALRATDDKYKIDEGREFLNAMVPSIEAYNLEVEIKQQEETVKKAEKKLTSLEDDQKDMEKKIKALQDKLEENKIEQKKQVEEVAKQKGALEAMLGRRKI